MFTIVFLLLSILLKPTFMSNTYNAVSRALTAVVVGALLGLPLLFDGGSGSLITLGMLVATAIISWKRIAKMKSPMASFVLYQIFLFSVFGAFFELAAFFRDNIDFGDWPTIVTVIVFVIIFASMGSAIRAVIHLLKKAFSSPYKIIDGLIILFLLINTFVAFGTAAIEGSTWVFILVFAALPAGAIFNAVPTRTINAGWGGVNVTMLGNNSAIDKNGNFYDFTENGWEKR